MKKILRKANVKLSIGSAALLLVTSSLIGQILGLMRVKLVNSNFPALGPGSTDAFFAAFKIPDFFFFTLAAGALGVAFMPVLADHVYNHDRKGVWRLSSSLLNFLALIMGVVGVIIFVFAEPLLHGLVAPKLEPEQLHNAVIIMRLIAFNPLLFTISGIFISVQQTFGRFFFYAIAPLIYNISIIVSIFVFQDSLGLIGLGVGALIGAILQLVIAFAGLAGLGFNYTKVIDWQMPDFRKVLRQLPPRSIDLGITSINSIVATNFARRLGTGNITFYESAYTLHTAPTLLIGTAISSAVFPHFNKSVAQGRDGEFRREFLQVLRIIIWIATPVVVVCFLGRGYLARMIFSRNAPEIAAIFGFLAGAIFFRTVYTIVARYFYAQKDTWTPLIDSLFAIVLYLVLVVNLSRPSSYGVTGIALAESIVAGCQLFILTSIMLWRDHKLFDLRFLGGVGRIISITGFTVLTSYIMIKLFPLNSTDTGFITFGFKLGIISLTTFAVHLGLSSLFELEEAAPIIKKLKKLSGFIFRPVKVEE